MIAAALLACAATVAPVTMDAIIGAEGGPDPLALHVNRLAGPQPHAGTVPEAAALARRYIAAGYSVDLGHAQINSRNLLSLGLTIEDALDPCTNVKGGGAILTAYYAQAVQRFGAGQTALGAAISAYNTGDFTRGYTNGYVARIMGMPSAPPGKAASPAHPPPPNPYTASTTVYSREDIHVRIE